MRLEHLRRLPPSLLALILVIGTVSGDSATTTLPPSSVASITTPARSQTPSVIITTPSVASESDTSSLALDPTPTHLPSTAANSTTSRTTLSTSYLFPGYPSATLLPSNSSSTNRSNTTTTTSSPVDPYDNDSGSDSDDDDDDDPSRSTKWITTYYYIVVVIAIVLILIAGFMYNLRRRHKKFLREKKLTARQRALAQDVDGLGMSIPEVAGSASGGGAYAAGNGRWFNPGHYWRGGSVSAAGMAGLAALGLTRRREGEEGLDEQGNAPPPYKPEDMGDGDGDTGRRAGNDIPLSRLNARRVSKPPTYHEVIEEVPDEEERASRDDDGSGTDVRPSSSSATLR